MMKVLNLKIGEELDKQTTQDMGGVWNLESKYKRLPDETINGATFLVIENPKWYGGSDRRLFLKKNNNIFLIGKTYNTPDELIQFKKFYSTFKFLDEKNTITPTKTQTITIPKDWKSFTDTDLQSKITATLSLPPGYSLRFSGSRWIIQNDLDAGELWNFYPDPGSLYDGTSRRAWVQKIYPDYKIIRLEEIPLEGSSYLKISIETPIYDNSGIASGTQVINHYVYVQNNIANMISPSSNKASSSQTVISQNIATIFSSLKVVK